MPQNVRDQFKIHQNVRDHELLARKYRIDPCHPCSRVMVPFRLSLCGLSWFPCPSSRVSMAINRMKRGGRRSPHAKPQLVGTNVGAESRDEGTYLGSIMLRSFVLLRGHLMSALCIFRFVWFSK